MPKVTAQGKTLYCELGANLRQVLRQNGIALHNPPSDRINCRGLGTCGTCAVQVEGNVSAANWRDRTRRSLPPHTAERDLRLACQTQVLGDLQVAKYDGFWGQGSELMWKATE